MADELEIDFWKLKSDWEMEVIERKESGERDGSGVSKEGMEKSEEVNKELTGAEKEQKRTG